MVSRLGRLEQPGEPTVLPVRPFQVNQQAQALFEGEGLSIRFLLLVSAGIGDAPQA